MSRILIIEDERDLALGLRANLEIEGYEVSLAHEGEEGFRHAVRGAPDLVILDLMLPDVDGYDVETAGTGVDAIAKVDSVSPALVILDLMLPDVDGIEVCRRIRRQTSIPSMSGSIRSRMISETSADAACASASAPVAALRTS